MAKCASCKTKKGKRNCPAFGEMICSLCCGTKKEKEIDCPVDCYFQSKAKEYASDRTETRRVLDFERELKGLVGREGPYENWLRDIEGEIYRIHLDHGNITDRDIERALEYLLEMGKAQLDIPSKFLVVLPQHIEQIVDGVDNALYFTDSFDKTEKLLMNKMKCIYRVLDSVRTHYAHDDPYSYLDFVGGFFGGYGFVG